MASVIRGNDNFDSSVVGSKTSRDAVGSYAGLYKISGFTGESQADQAGSGLSFHNAGLNGSATYYASGTWRCMGMIYGNGAATARYTVWLRIS